MGSQPGGGGRPSPGDWETFWGSAGHSSPVEAGSVPRCRDGPAWETVLERGNRPGAGDRPNLGDRNQWANNRVISNRPQWANIDRSTNINIHNRWNNAFVNPSQRGWWTRPPARIGFWNGWGNGVRRSWVQFRRPNPWFTAAWWNRHPFPVGGWHFHFWRHSFPARHWWTVPAWGRVTTWFTWSAPPTVWSQPVYYDYGSGGNVIYQNNNVYVGGEQVATADEFAMSAMDLATVPAPQSDEQAAAAEWLPLGTFAVSTHEKDVEPSQVVQLAVSKEGIVSGTLYNIDTDQAQAIQGQVDGRLSAWPFASVRATASWPKRASTI